MSSDTSGKPTITGLVLTYNGERLLGKCLESLAFCDAVIVVDSFSSDATESIAREHGATFVQHPWSGALPQFEYALGLVETDWVVSLDQDEICSEPLRDAILAALPGAPADLCGFTPARRSWYYDRFLKHSGWYPDRLLRVFRRNGVHFTQSGAHEHIDPNGRTRELDGDILHYPYKHFREHLDKINSYAQQGADDLAARGKKGGLALGVLHGMAALVRRHPYGRDGGAAIHPLRKVHDIGAGVVVIGQLPAYLVHLHIAQPVVVQDLPGDLRRRAAPHAAHLGIFGIGGLYPELRP